MKKKKVTLDVFEDSVLPQLQAKHADAKALQKAIDDGYDIYEESEDGKTVTAVKFTVSVNKAPIEGKSADDEDGADGDADDDEVTEKKSKKGTGAKSKKTDEPAPRSDEDLAKLIGETVAKTLATMSAAAPATKRKHLQIDGPRKTDDAADDGYEFKGGKEWARPKDIRPGQLKNFEGTVSEKCAEERAFRFGHWCLASISKQMPGKYDFTDSVKFVENYIGKLHQTNVNATGGFLVPEEFGTDMIDLREKRGVVRRLFKRVSMSSDTRTDPRRTGGLTAYFVTEGAAGTESTKSWDNVRLTAKDIMVLTRYTNQLNADAVISIGDDLAGEISYSFADLEDQCGFNGTGASAYGGIRGIRTLLTDIDGAGTDSAGLKIQGTSNTWSAMVLADFDAVVGKLPQYADTPNAAWVMHRTFYYEIVEKLVQAAGGVPAYEVREGNRRPRPMFKGYPVEFSQVFPSVTATTGVMATLGDYTLAASFGDRQGDQIAFSDQATIGGQSLWERNQIGVRGTERMDINVHDIGNATAPGPVVGLATG